MIEAYAVRVTKILCEASGEVLDKHMNSPRVEGGRRMTLRESR
jgi:hypothetical protein